jgi:hypothetical protein
MSLVISDLGDALALGRMLDKTAQGDLKLHLFTNNYTPGKGDTTSSVTEASDGSYSAATLTGASWSIATVSHTTTATYPAVTFTFAGAQTVYGYYLTDSGGTTLVGAELFASALTIPSSGGTITVTLNIVGN